MPSYIITVDTGGSKTQITLFDLDGKKLSDTRCVGIGVTQEQSANPNILVSAFRDLMDDKNYADVCKVVINVGGTNTEQIKTKVLSIFPNAQIEAFRESSGIIMSAICDAEKVDVLLMAGTGSIALAKGKLGNIITDGWCPNIGDFGSGYWIGLQAISRSVLELEKKGPFSSLAQNITGRNLPFSAVCNTYEQMLLRDEVRSHFMPLERASVAKLTKLTAKHARSGDKLATEIFYDAGRELAKTVVRAMNLVECKSNAIILVSGGLTACCDLWKNSFDKELHKEKENCTWYVGDADMTKGALYYALNYM